MASIVYRMKFKPTFLSDTQKLAEIVRKSNIKPVKQISFSFDPFASQTESIRTLVGTIHSRKLLQNTTVKTKVDVRSDRSPPQMDVLFNDGHKLLFKTEHLKAWEVMETLNRFCAARDTSQAEADVQLTKMSGKSKKRK